MKVTLCVSDVANIGVNGRSYSFVSVSGILKQFCAAQKIPSKVIDGNPDRGRGRYYINLLSSGISNNTIWPASSGKGLQDKYENPVSAPAPQNTRPLNAYLKRASR